MIFKLHKTTAVLNAALNTAGGAEPLPLPPPQLRRNVTAMSARLVLVARSGLNAHYQENLAPKTAKKKKILSWF